MYFSVPAKVNYYDCDECDSLKLSGAMRYMQQASSEHLEFLGIPNAMLLEDGTAFVLTKYDILIHRMPKAGEEIVTGTAPNRIKGIRFYREFRMDAMSGERLLSAITQWVLIEPVSRKLLRPSAFPYELPLVETIIGHEVEDTPLTKGEEGVDGEPISVDIRYSHIDAIGHVNNSYYADFACDALPRDELQKRGLEKASIVFQSEARWGDRVVITPRSLSSSEYLVFGNHEDSRCFTAYIKLKD